MPAAILPDMPDEAMGALDLWIRLRGARSLPSRSDFRPLDWRAWMSDISIVELHDGDPRYFVALHGGRTQEHIGVNFHKKYLETGLTPDTRALALEPYRESERTGLPTFSTMAPRLYRGVTYTLWRLVMPFTDDTPDGGPQQVDRFVVWVGAASRRPYDFDTLYKSLQSNVEDRADMADRVSLSVLSV